MKEIVLALSNYTIWANNNIINTIIDLPEEKTKETVVSSFPGLYATILHMLDSSTIWWQRHKLAERIIRPSEDFTGSFADAAQALQKQDKVWRDWIASATEPMLQHEFIYQNSKKEQYKQPTFQMLLHLFNHATYHRGQLVTILRQLGVTKIPSTDYIEFTRKKVIL